MGSSDLRISDPNARITPSEWAMITDYIIPRLEASGRLVLGIAVTPRPAPTLILLEIQEEDGEQALLWLDASLWPIQTAAGNPEIALIADLFDGLIRATPRDPSSEGIEAPEADASDDDDLLRRLGYEGPQRGE